MDVTSNFHCTQEELISVCKKGWNSCLGKVVDFVVFKPKYTAEFISGKLTAVDIADNLPTDVQRKDAEETQRVILVDANIAGCANWQKLKRYITEAFEDKMLQIKLNTAGIGSYEKASNENWESGSSLMKLGNQFITDNFVNLTANDNMPPVFQDSFKAGKDFFDKALTRFQEAESDSVTGTQDKTDAMNGVFGELMSMMLDGQEIYKTGDEATKKQFIFEQVLKLVSGTGAQGFKGMVRDSVTGLAVDKVVVTVLMTKHSTMSDKAGVFGMRNVAHGDAYTVTFQRPGYATASFEKEKVAVGVMTTLDVALVATVEA